MALIKYNAAKKRIIDGDLEFDTADIRVLLLQAASDADADDDTVSAVLARAGTTELTSAGYSRQACANQTTTEDETNDRAEFSADTVVFPLVSQATTETVVAHLFYLHVTDDTDSIPLWLDDTPAEYPLTPSGADIEVLAPAEGFAQVS